MLKLFRLLAAPANEVHGSERCARCGAIARLGNGACVRCLLDEGTDADGEVSQEELLRGFQEDDIPDREWRLGNYEVLSEIGRGGMGVIYQARQRYSNRVVALKRMLSSHADDLEWKERFRREAQAAAGLDHPNILPIYEVGEGEDGLPFFSMKYAPGGSLLEAKPALRNEPRQCATLMAKVAHAVQHAHSQGILHRDLKPGNIMLDRRGEPLVSDFGLAKWLDASNDITRTLTIFGTPGYVAPEQARRSAENLTPAADVYSLGAILFDLFTGRPPFLGEHALAVIQQASEKPAPKLRTLAPALDRDLETICAKCLEREPQARYASAGDLAVDLERWLEGHAIIARRVSPPVRIWRWSRRNPRLAAAAAGCLLLGMAVVWLLREQVIPARHTLIPEKSIAVLPFENLSEEKQNEYFADGVQDEILTDLAKIADLKVISRSSVMQYKSGLARNLRKIGEELGVAHVMEGSVQRSANKIRVNVQLIDARNAAHLWAQTYDRDLADVFAIQSEIAKAIAEQLQAKLSPNEKAEIEKPPTTDLAAFGLYTRAKTLLLSLGFTVNSQQNLQQAIELLNQAVARDQSFFEAYYQLVFAQGAAYSTFGDHTPARLALAEAALQAATRLRPEAGETHLARANYLYFCLRDYNGALADLEVARRSLPNDPRVFGLTGYIARRRGQPEEGARNLERSVQLDPRNVQTLQQLAISYQYLRHYPEEAAVLDRALTIAPNDVSTKTQRALVDFHWKAEMRPLHETIDSILAAGPSAISDAAGAWYTRAMAERDPTAAQGALGALGDNPFWGDGAVYLRRSFGEGLLARMMKDEARARAAFTKARLEQEKIVQAQPDYGPALCVLGLIDAALGRKEEALREGRRAIEVLPAEKDSMDGSRMLVYFAITAAWAGDKGTALQYLAANAQSPGGYQVATYGVLKLLPFWDPLRGDPRFEKIVSSLAPKEPLK